MCVRKYSTFKYIEKYIYNNFQIQLFIILSLYSIIFKYILKLYIEKKYICIFYFYYELL